MPKETEGWRSLTPHSLTTPTDPELQVRATTRTAGVSKGILYVIIRHAPHLWSFAAYAPSGALVAHAIDTVKDDAYLAVQRQLFVMGLAPDPGNTKMAERARKRHAARKGA